MWARYLPAQWDQGSGRHDCNNLYDRDTDEKVYKQMKASCLWQNTHEDFLKIIKPSFFAVDEDEDLDAILAKTRLIVLLHPVGLKPTQGSHGFITARHLQKHKMNPHLHECPPWRISYGPKNFPAVSYMVSAYRGVQQCTAVASTCLANDLRRKMFQARKPCARISYTEIDRICIC